MKIEGDLSHWGLGSRATVARAMLEKEDNLKGLAALGERSMEVPLRVRDRSGAGRKRRPHDEAIAVAKEQEQRVLLTQQLKRIPRETSTGDVRRRAGGGC